jgi:hypothetical protein
VAYADKVDGRDGVALKTFDRGHVLYDVTLVDELQHLVGGHGTTAAGESA